MYSKVNFFFLHQETLVNLAALIVSLIITPLVSGHTLTTWTLFIIFSIFHVYANYKAVTAVVMNVMNRNRLFKVLDEFVASTNHHILSPSAANRAEPVFLRKYNIIFYGTKLNRCFVVNFYIDRSHLNVRLMI